MGEQLDGEGSHWHDRKSSEGIGAGCGRHVWVHGNARTRLSPALMLMVR